MKWKFLKSAHYSSNTVSTISTQIVITWHVYFAGRFTNIVARWPGSTLDSHIFTASAICDFLEENHSGLNDGLLLGDSGYRCKPYLMTPFLTPKSQAERKYNGANKTTRCTIEWVFGWWKRRFHVLHSEVSRININIKIIIGLYCTWNHMEYCSYTITTPETVQFKKTHAWGGAPILYLMGILVVTFRGWNCGSCNF